MIFWNRVKLNSLCWEPIETKAIFEINGKKIKWNNVDFSHKQWTSLPVQAREDDWRKSSSEPGRRRQVSMRVEIRMLRLIYFISSANGGEPMGISPPITNHLNPNPMRYETCYCTPFINHVCWDQPNAPNLMVSCTSSHVGSIQRLKP